MTKEEAIQVLKEHKKEYFHTSRIENAIDMAIDALSAKLSGDLISRAEVITTLKTIPYDEEMWADVQDSLIYQISIMPSVSAERQRG